MTSQRSPQDPSEALASDGGLRAPDLTHGGRDSVIVLREMGAEHGGVHLVHDPLALHGRDGRVPDGGARVGVHDAGDRAHRVDQEQGIQVEEILLDGRDHGERLVRDHGRHVPGHRGRRVERLGDQHGGHVMPVGPTDLGEQRPARPAAAQPVVEKVQRPAIPVRRAVLGHLARGRVQPETQEFDRPSVDVQVRLGLGPVQPEPVLVKPGEHRGQVPTGRVAVGRHEQIVVDEPVQPAARLAVHQVRQPVGVQFRQQQVAQGHGQSVALHHAPGHHPPEAAPFHGVAPDAPAHLVPDPEQRHRVRLVVEHQRPALELGRRQSAHVPALLAVHGTAAADFHHVHRVHGHRRPLLAETFLDPVPDDRPQFVVHEAGERVPEIRTHVVQGAGGTATGLLERLPLAEELRLRDGPVFDGSGARQAPQERQTIVRQPLLDDAFLPSQFEYQTHPVGFRVRTHFPVPVRRRLRVVGLDLPEKPAVVGHHGRYLFATHVRPLGLDHVHDPVAGRGGRHDPEAVHDPAEDERVDQPHQRFGRHLGPPVLGHAVQPFDLFNLDPVHDVLHRVIV